jgi:hypothetical protein
MTTAKKAPAKKAAAKKSVATESPAKKTAKKAAHCWPGFEPVPGKEPGTKGSCEPKEHQTKGEKKADSKAAAGSKLQKAGGNKAKANKSKA